MSLRQRALDLVLRILNVVHRAVLRATRGRAGRRLLGMAAVELHTVGRRSGQRRSVMLTAPVSEPDRVVLVASKAGDDRNPDWYVNLVADPEVEITRDGVTTPWRARTATPAEKAELWPRITAAHRVYAGHQRRTTRDIPVVICEPA